MHTKSITLFEQEFCNFSTPRVNDDVMLHNSRDQ